MRKTILSIALLLALPSTGCFTASGYALGAHHDITTGSWDDPGMPTAKAGAIVGAFLDAAAVGAAIYFHPAPGDEDQ